MLRRKRITEADKQEHHRQSESERHCVMSLAPVTTRPDRPVSAWQFRAWELIAPRLPLWARVLLGRAFMRLPLDSRARRWCLLRMAMIVWDATAARRYDLVLPVCDPAGEWRWDAGFVGLGFEEVYRGRDGVERALEDWNRYWTEISFNVREVLDGGDRGLLRLTASGTGVSSGVPTQMQFSQVVHLDPLVVELHNFLHDEDALREAGFAPLAQDASAPAAAGPER